MPVLAWTRPVNGGSRNRSESVPVRPPTGRPAATAANRGCDADLDRPQQGGTRDAIGVREAGAVVDRHAGQRDSERTQRGLHDLDAVRGRRRCTRLRVSRHIAHQLFGGEVVAHGQHVRHDRPEGRRVDVGDFPCAPARHTVTDHGSDLHAPLAEQGRQLLPGHDCGIGCGRCVVSVAGASVDGERAQRADVAVRGVFRFPLWQESERVLRVVIDDQAARQRADTGRDNGVGQPGERRVDPVPVQGLLIARTRCRPALRAPGRRLRRWSECRHRWPAHAS